MAALSRRLCRSLLSNPNPKSSLLINRFFCTTTNHLTSDKEDSDLEEPEAFLSDSEPVSPESSSPKEPYQRRDYKEPQLENGLDMGIYKVHFI